MYIVSISKVSIDIRYRTLKEGKEMTENIIEMGKNKIEVDKIETINVGVEFPTIEEIYIAIDKFKPFVLDQVNKSNDGIVRIRVQDIITEFVTEFGQKFASLANDHVLLFNSFSDRLKLFGQKEEELLVVESGTHISGDKLLIFSRPNMLVGWKSIQENIGNYIRDTYTDVNINVPSLSNALIGAFTTIEQMQKDLENGEVGDIANIYDLGVNLVKIDIAYRKELKQEVKIKLRDIKKVNRNIKDAIKIIQDRLGNTTGLETETLRDVLLRLDRVDGTIDRTIDRIDI